MGCCTCYSSHGLGVSHCPSLSKRATQKPTRVCIGFPWPISIGYMGCLITYPMSIYSCFAFDKGSEFARLQTVKEQSAIVDTFPYMYPHPSASAFASVSEQRRCKGTHFHRIMMHFLRKNALLYIK